MFRSDSYKIKILLDLLKYILNSMILFYFIFYFLHRPKSQILEESVKKQ